MTKFKIKYSKMSQNMKNLHKILFWSILSFMYLVDSASADCGNLCNPKWIETATYDEVAWEIVIKRAEPNTAGSRLLGSPLSLAVMYKNKPAIKALLEYGADPNLQSAPDYTPIFWSTDPEITSLLISHGADVNYRRDNGLTPIFNAANDEIWQLLKENGADINVHSLNGLSTIMLAPSKDIFDELLRLGMDPTQTLDDGSNAFFYNTNPQILNELFNLGVDVNAQDQNGNTAFHRYPSTTLLDLGANPRIQNNEGDTPIFTMYDAERLKIICDSVPDAINDTNSSNHNLLMSAVQRTFLNEDFYLQILDCGVDINAQDARGNTALHIATEFSNEVAIEILLSHNANIRLLNEKNESALDIAKSSILLDKDLIFRMNETWRNGN